MGTGQGNKELILREIARIRPDWISNSQLESRSGVTPHQQVFQITRRLKRRGAVDSERRGNIWFFRFRDGPDPAPPAAAAIVSPNVAQSRPETPAEFEARARRVLGDRLGVSLMARSLPEAPKKFDLVSADGGVAGDAKYFSLVKGTGKPPAKFSIIAEHVWLLEKTSASCRFLVFGNDPLVPTMWLKRYGHLAGAVAFLFLREDDALEVLSDPSGEFPTNL